MNMIRCTHVHTSICIHMICEYTRGHTHIYMYMYIYMYIYTPRIDHVPVAHMFTPSKWPPRWFPAATGQPLWGQVHALGDRVVRRHCGKPAINLPFGNDIFAICAFFMWSCPRSRFDDPIFSPLGSRHVKYVRMGEIRFYSPGLVMPPR